MVAINHSTFISSGFLMKKKKQDKEEETCSPCQMYDKQKQLEVIRKVNNHRMSQGPLIVQ